MPDQRFEIHRRAVIHQNKMASTIFLVITACFSGLTGSCHGAVPPSDDEMTNAFRLHRSELEALKTMYNSDAKWQWISADDAFPPLGAAEMRSASLRLAQYRRLLSSTGTISVQHFLNMPAGSVAIAISSPSFGGFGVHRGFLYSAQTPLAAGGCIDGGWSQRSNKSEYSLRPLGDGWYEFEFGG